MPPRCLVLDMILSFSVRRKPWRFSSLLFWEDVASWRASINSLGRDVMDDVLFMCFSAMSAEMVMGVDVVEVDRMHCIPWRRCIAEQDSEKLRRHIHPV